MLTQAFDFVSDKRSLIVGFVIAGCTMSVPRHRHQSSSHRTVNEFNSVVGSKIREVVLRG